MSEQQSLDEISAETPRRLDFGPRSLELPKGWSKSEFGEIFTHQRGLNYSSDNYVEEGEGMIFLTLNAISPGGGLKKDSLKFYNDDISDEKKVSAGDVLMANTDLNQDGEIIGYPVRVPPFDSNVTKCFSHHLLKIEQKKEVYQGHFLEYLLSAKYVHDRMIAFSCGSTVLNLNTDLLGSLELPVPPLSEQRKIATVLYTVDRAIEKTEDTIERLNRIQKGTLRNLFENGVEKEVKTQDSPMGRFPKHWELKPMKKVGSLINGSAFPKEYQGVSDGKYPFIKVSDTNNYRRFVTGAKNYITEEIAEEMRCNIHPEGTVILPKRGAAIMTNKRRILAQDSAIDNNQIGIVGEEVEPLFLYYYLLDVDMGRFVQEGAVKSLTKSLLSKIRVPVPSPETQSKIVKTLERIDERIEAEKQVKNQQERLKRGLTQDLLSGTVRTTDTNIEVPDEIAQHG